MSHYSSLIDFPFDHAPKLLSGIFKPFDFKPENRMDFFVQGFRVIILRLTKRAQMFLMFKLFTSFSDKLCSRVELPAGKTSEIHPLFGKTIVLSVASADEVSLTLYQKPQVASARYRFSIGKAQSSQLYRSDEGQSESSKITANTPNVLNKSQMRYFWIDVRSSNLVLGSGNETLLQWNDPSPISVSYVSFTADPNEKTLFLLFNKASESKSILALNLLFNITHLRKMHTLSNLKDMFRILRVQHASVSGCLQVTQT